MPYNDRDAMMCKKTIDNFVCVSQRYLVSGNSSQCRTLCNKDYKVPEDSIAYVKSSQNYDNQQLVTKEIIQQRRNNVAYDEDEDDDVGGIGLGKALGKAGAKGLVLCAMGGWWLPPGRVREKFLTKCKADRDRYRK